MEKNMQEDSGFDAYAKINEENALKEDQEKALKTYEDQKDKESSGLYDKLNKSRADREEVKKSYESQFSNPEKGSEEDIENKKNEKMRQADDIEKEKRAAELKKEEEKIQEKEEFNNTYKRQFGEAEDNVASAPVDNKKTVVKNIDTPVINAPVDNETDLQKIIRERNENMPKKINDELIDNDLKKRAAEILATGEKDTETQRKIINKQDNRNNDLSIENEQLEKFFERANNRLDAMKDELDKQIEEVKDPTLKESIITFLKKPKVKGAIVFGLAGAVVYAASGGTAVPVYFAVKAALAKVGISIFVPAVAGHGLSTWGTAAVAGGATGEFASYLSKKLGLSKSEKNDKEKHQAGLDNLKNIASGFITNETKLGNVENIKQQPPEVVVEPENKIKPSKEYVEKLKLAFDKDVADIVEKFNAGKLDGEEAYEFVKTVSDKLNSPAGKNIPDVLNAYKDTRRNINEKALKGITVAMIDYAMSKGMDHEETHNLVSNLTLKIDEHLKEFVDEKAMNWLITGEEEEEKKEFISKIEKTRDPLVEASENNLEDFIKNSSELQAIIKTIKDPKVSISDLGKMVESWNAKYPGILTGLYVQKEYKGKEKAIKITMDDKGNVWVAGGDPDGLKYLKY